MSGNSGQGTSTCLNCSTQSPAGAAFCPACGHALNATQAVSWGPPAAPAPEPPPPTPAWAPTPAPMPPTLAPDYSLPQGYGQPPTTQQPQGYGPVPGYPTGYGYAPTPARSNSTPIFVALGLIGLVVVIVAGAVFLSSAGGPHATSAAPAIALATPAA